MVFMRSFMVTRCCQWQHMVARQRRQRQVGQCVRIDPHHLVDFGAWYDRPFDVNGINGGTNPVIRLIRRSTFEDAERPCAVLRDAATQFFDQFARERGDIALAGIAFAARLHEDRGPALADKQYASIFVADQRRDDADNIAGHSSFSEKRPNWPGSRAGSGKPRCWNARAVSSRPRGVRCRKPFWIRNGSMMSSIASRG